MALTASFWDSWKATGTIKQEIQISLGGTQDAKGENRRKRCGFRGKHKPAISSFSFSAKEVQ
jgi:hypothetical protein